MQVHTYISKQASAESRLRSIFENFRQIFSYTEHIGAYGFNKVVLENFNETAVAVIMVGNKEELIPFTMHKMTWGRFKTILVLPDSDLNEHNLIHLLRPIYTTNMSSDFRAIVDILNHINHKQDPIFN